MICSKCGEDIQDEAKYCSHCGVQIEGEKLPSEEMTDESKMSSLKSAYNSASQAVSSTAKAAKNIGGKVATHVGDLNGDGKVDVEDLKIAADKTKQVASAGIDEAAKLGKSTLQSDLVKEAAAGAAVGAVIAVPVPLVGPTTGAAVGATLGAYKHFTKK